MYLNAGTIPISPESRDDVAALLAAAREASLAEPGVQAYEFALDLWDPGTIRLFEVYQDEAALREHMEQPHTRQLFAALRPHLTGRATMTGYQATEANAFG